MESHKTSLRRRMLAVLPNIGWACVAIFCMSAQNSPNPSTAPLDLQASMQNAQQFIAQKKFTEAESLLAKIVGENSRAANAWFVLGFVRQNLKKYDLALEAYSQASSFPNVKPTALYNMGCVYALTNKPDLAFDSLKKSVEAGFIDREQFFTDADLDSLRQDSRFAGAIPAMLEGSAAFVEDVRVIHTFDGEQAGSEFGWTARKVGDLDSDGNVDFLLTSGWSPVVGKNTGRVFIIAGPKTKRD